jgi:PPOX class probable F420-dependent enzyme
MAPISAKDAEKERPMTKLEREHLEFLEQPFVGVVTTLRADGSSHNTVVWIDVDEGKPSFNTARGRAKAKHLERDPRAAVTVVDPNDPYKWLAIDGRAELTTDGANEQIDKLAFKYEGRESFDRPAEQIRVKVRITPDRVTTYGF